MNEHVREGPEHGPLAKTISLPRLIGNGGPARVRPGCRCGWHGDQELPMTDAGIKEALEIACMHVAGAIL